MKGGETVEHGDKRGRESKKTSNSWYAAFTCCRMYFYWHCDAFHTHCDAQTTKPFPRA